MTVMFLSILVGIGFMRSRLEKASATMSDRGFVTLVVFALMLPALIAGPLIHRAATFPWIECVAVFAATVGVSCTPLLIAQLIHRMRTGKWWTSASSLIDDSPEKSTAR